jgi:hypothetical protein
VSQRHKGRRRVARSLKWQAARQGLTARPEPSLLRDAWALESLARRRGVERLSIDRDGPAGGPA